MHLLLHVLGIDTQQSYAYDFWSGFGPCLIASLTLGTGLWAYIRQRNCHVRRCWRLGRHKVPGTEHVVCGRHAPHERPSHADVIRDWERARHQDTR